MRILIATRGFAHPGGSETYVLTVAEQFERLGHEVVIVADELGPFSAFAEDRGLVVRSSLDGLDGWADAAIVQDSLLAYRFAERLPGTPQLFRAASDLYDLSLPPGLPGVVQDVVVCSDRVGRRIAALSTRPVVHRLRQPIDTERFMPAGVPGAAPRSAVLLGNYLRGERLEMITGALEAAGVSIVQIGALGEADLTPERALWQADIVVAKGRAALEGMACGRPVLVFDQFGADGWVTADRYPAMEADNFAGLSGPPIVGREGLIEELADYDPGMGLVNRELVIANHSARAHVDRLGELLERVDSPVRADDAPLRELARLVDMQWRTEMRALGFEEASRRASEHANRVTEHSTRVSEHADRVREHAARVEAELEAVRRHVSAVEAEAAAARQARDRAERERDRLAGELGRAGAVMDTRRVRGGLLVGRVADAARRRLPGR